MTEGRAIRQAILVDDERIDHRPIRRIAERSGLVETLHTFDDPDAAMRHIEAEGLDNIDVIFLDIRMPVMSGFDFLAEGLKRFGPDFGRLDVVMLTASMNPDDYWRAKEFPMVRDFITKPLTEAHLARVAGQMAAAPT